jgi:magnesium-transporting ATPase (P-type)
VNNLQKMAQAKSVLRWGGLAGILGGIIFILVFFIVAMFVGMEPVDPVREVVRFPEIKTARIVENSLYLAVLILGVVHFLALYRALRETSLAPALFGSALGILGLVVLAAGSLPHVATTPISNFYHASGATAADQATLVLLWQATMGIFDALLMVGLIFLHVGLIALAVAMFGAPAFGKGVGGLSLLLGVVGILGASAEMAGVAPIAALGILALILFHLVLGWKVYTLARAL